MDASPLTPQETACYQVLHRILANHLQQGMGWPTLLTVVVRLLGQCVLQGVVTRSVRLADLAFMDETAQTLQAWFTQTPTQPHGLVVPLAQEKEPYGEQAAYMLRAGLGRVLTEYREEHGLTVWSTQRVAMRLLCEAGAALSLALAQDQESALPSHSVALPHGVPQTAGPSRSRRAQARTTRSFSLGLCGSGGFEGLPLDFDDAAFYRRFDSFSTSGRQMRQEGRDHGAMVRG